MSEGQPKLYSKWNEAFFHELKKITEPRKGPCMPVVTSCLLWDSCPTAPLDYWLDLLCFERYKDQAA